MKITAGKKKKPFPGKNLSDFERGFNTGYDKGIRKGRLEGYEYGMTVLLMVLNDKFEPTTEDLHKLFNDIDSYHTMIMKDNASFKDFQKTLHEEYHMSFKFQ